MTQYDAPAIEQKWQDKWEQADCFTASIDHDKPKYYVLEMFPYPSGRIHMGHVRNYTLGDVVARYRRAKGFNVLHPMGWDAFGLPAENAAMERGVHPGKWTIENIAAMRTQLKSMGLSYDWSREFATCSPDYYQHEQKMFLKFLEAGLAYRKESWVNWDPVENTVLANEQVVDGCGWRSGAPVERRLLSQWFLKITDFADELLAAIGDLDRWPDRVRLMQQNWIGKSEGARVRFSIDGKSPIDADHIEVFTTRPDTLFGASFLAIAANHPLALAIGKNVPAAADFITECAKLGTSEAAVETAEKKGFDTGLQVSHPLDPAIKLPVHIANFVLMDYGTGAIFGCPAHDQRDLDFANAYGLQILPVVLPDGEDAANFTVTDTAYTGPGKLFNSGLGTVLISRLAKPPRLPPLPPPTLALARQLTGFVTGAYRASAIGAVRSRSSIAMIAVLSPCQKKTFRLSCLTMLILAVAAIRYPAIQAGNILAVQNAVKMPNANKILSTHFLKAHGIFCAMPIQHLMMASMARPRHIGCRLINILAGLNMRFCICFIRAFSPAHCHKLAI